ncbi:hypothetical protein O1611_g872 [Lasiodiplodia mahajangana]|uniref:Uncharacterized protein n=1 Tax=Lasiodiplodia mahajangana TaxID=1108764 RepID=A0ACC2JZ02_9PEZI|nr:hypothetical protein O1611_g872 [Lasiodiplodia mahajangana]
MDYTIAWICLHEDMEVAVMLLDEKHNPPESLPVSDAISCAFGRINSPSGGRDIVIIGTSQDAADSLRIGDYMRNFLEIQVSLFVGTGGSGGDPAKHDIRLGDVVVATPVDRRGTPMLQYQYDKTIQEKTLAPAVLLFPKPPLSYLTLVPILEAEHKFEGHKINETIAAVLSKSPTAQAKYQRPVASTDRLYKPDVVHRDGDNKGCALSCGDDESKLVLRKARPENRPDPKIHHGFIASSDRPVEDALIRDKISEENGILCFDVGAAAMVPAMSAGCLAIRGICDYSDSHRNSVWRGYAAMTAAAYTRELIATLC